MTDSSSQALDRNPDAMARRLMQKAHNRDGLPEIAIGLTLLTAAASMWMQAAFERGSPVYRMAPLFLGVGVPVMILGSQWAIKAVRRRFLIERFGYVEYKPVNRRRAGIVAAVAFAVAVATAVAIIKGALPPGSWILAGTGIGGGLLAVLSVRSIRFVVGGAIMAGTGIMLAFSRVSLETGYLILYCVMGILSLVSGCVVFVHFLRQAAAIGE